MIPERIGFMTVTAEIRDTLAGLIEVCRDGQRLFAAAAEAVPEQILKAELIQYSMQRDDFARELKDAVLGLGESVPDTGSLSGAFQRGWMNLRSVLSGGDRSAILAECERSEDRTADTYRAARVAVLPQAIAALLETQYEAVVRVHDRIRSLRDSANQQ
jgi:uncharacterized protein (TIGR02284 family)